MILPVVRLHSEAELRYDCFSEPSIHSWRFCGLNRNQTDMFHCEVIKASAIVSQIQHSA